MGATALIASTDRHALGAMAALTDPGRLADAIDVQHHRALAGGE